MRLAVGMVHLDGRGLRHLGQQAADANFQAGLAQDVGETCHIAQVVMVTGVVLGDEQHPTNVGAVVLNGGHHGLHRHWPRRGREVVESTRKEVGVHGRELEAGVAKVYRAVEGGLVAAPLRPKPVFDLDALGEHAALEREQGPAQAGLKVWGEHVRHGRTL
jgi:hypothetical protein